MNSDIFPEPPSDTIGKSRTPALPPPIKDSAFRSGALTGPTEWSSLGSQSIECTFSPSLTVPRLLDFYEGS